MVFLYTFLPRQTLEYGGTEWIRKIYILLVAHHVQERVRYGNTLLYETDTDFLKGERAVFECICENPQHATPEEVCDFGTKLFEKFRQCRKCGYEFHEWQILKCKYERYGITFSVPMDEVEKIIWTNSSVGKRMHYVEEMLHLLHKQGIRTGVISNIG